MELQKITMAIQSTAGILPSGLSDAGTSRQPISSSTTSTTAADSAPGTSRDVTIDWSPSLSHFRKYSEGKITLDPATDAAKQAGGALNPTGSVRGNTKLQVEGIVKNYPPFPPGDSQRMEYLKGFISLRQQIEQLTFPPDKSDTAAQAVRETSADKAAATPASERGVAQNSRSIQAALATTSSGLSLPDNPLLKQL